MNRNGQSRLARLRALFAALFLLIAAVSGPVTLAAQTADACGMACCIKEGFCCCNPHHATVKGRVSDENPHLSQADLSASCPQGCAQTARFSNQLFRHHLQTSAQQLVADEPSIVFIEELVAASDLFSSGSSGPRAPPVSSNL
jgi:hypothetical protein